MTGHAPRTKARWAWLLVLPLLALLHTFADAVPVDRHNVAMKAPGSKEAEATARLQSTFGAEDQLVLAFLTRTHSPLAPIERQALDHLGQRLRGESVVTNVGKLLEPRPDLAILKVQVESSADVGEIVGVAEAMAPSTLRLLPAGLPIAEAAVAEGIAGDRRRLVPAIVGVLFAMLAMFYRSFVHALSALAPALFGILLLGSFRYALGQQLDPVSVLLDPVLLTIGVAASVHFLAAFREQRRLGLAPRDAALAARSGQLRPATLATLTTMLGFWSLSFHPVPAVANFGTLAALGTGLVHAIVLAVLPFFLIQFPGAVPPATALVRSMDPYAHWLRRHRKAVCALGAALAVASAVALRDVRVDNDPLAVLPVEAACRRDLLEIADHLGGAEHFDLLVEHAATQLGPERLLPFAAAIAATPPAAGPAGAPRAALDGTVKVPLLLAPSGSDARTRLFDAAEARAQALDLPGIHLAGNSVQIARDSDRLVQGQLRGMAIAVAFLTIALAFALRSARLAVLGMLPNLLPCLLVYGGLAASGRPLGVANAMIGSVMLGLVVDNTIHFLHHYREHPGTALARVRRALEHVASPMLGSSLVLALGFGSGLLGDMASTHEFAALSAATIGLALFGDAVLLPALLLALSPREEVTA